jgi:hypothetical protein
MRCLPRTPRWTWLLAGAVWLAACGLAWWAVPCRPQAAWPTDKPVAVHGFIPGTSVLLTSGAWRQPTSVPPVPLRGPLLARDTVTGGVREWYPSNELLTLVDPGPDGRHVLVGRVVGGRARLFLHDMADGSVIAELPREGPRAENEGDGSPDAYEQFAAFRPDGRRIVYADRPGDRSWLRVWDVQTRREVAAIADAEGPAAWSADGRTFAFRFHVHGSDLWSVHLWSEEAAKTLPIASVVPLNAEPLQVAFSSDGTTLVGVLADHDVRRNFLVGWDVATRSEKYRVRTICADFVPRQTSLVAYEVGAGLANLRRFDFATGAQNSQFSPGPVSVEGVTWLGVAPDGLHLLGGRRDSNRLLDLLDRHFWTLGPFAYERPSVFDIETGRLACSMPMALREGYGHGATTCGWSRDRALLAVAGRDTLAVWDVPPRKPWSWFCPMAAVLAVPAVWFARRRVRRLRREAAA